MDRHDRLDAVVLHGVVDTVHRLGAVGRAALQDHVLEQVQRGPPGRRCDDVLRVEVLDDRGGGGGTQGLRQGQDVGLDLLVDLVGHLGVVLVVPDVLGDVDVVAADAALLVDPVPEGLLAVDDQRAGRGERADGQVGQRAEVDAAVVRVDRLGTRVAGDADVGGDVAAAIPAAAARIFTAAATAGREHGEAGQRGCCQPAARCVPHGISLLAGTGAGRRWPRRRRCRREFVGGPRGPREKAQ
jgi:hypothetical protein